MKKRLYILPFSLLFFILSCAKDKDIQGCTDSTAVNFNSEATLEDDSCLFDSDGDGVYDNDEILGCTNDEACNFNIEATDSDDSCEYAEEGYDCQGDLLISPEVGLEMFGGIVFYVDQTGQHGLVVAMEELGEFNWGCPGTILPGADGIEIGAGLQNTLDIVSGCSEVPIAASVALAYEGGGYTDWYLPSLNELIEMYNTIGQGSDNGNVGGFLENWYWTSTEDNSDAAYCYHFGYSAVGGNHRYGMINVRVIRSF